VTSPVFQFSITFLENAYQFVFQVLQVSDLASNLDKFGADQIPDSQASKSTTISQVEKLFDFLPGETESLHLLDKSDSRYVVCCVKPELSCRPVCSRQQRLALAEPDRVYAQVGALGSFADLDRAHRTRQTVWHKEIIHSGLYSRVKSTFARSGSADLPIASLTTSKEILWCPAPTAR
jgi:hypothetical protein